MSQFSRGFVVGLLVGGFVGGLAVVVVGTGVWAFLYLPNLGGALSSSAVNRDPGSLQGYRRHVGQTFRFEVTGSTTGTVWGSDLYTDDSNLATACVHAGILRPGEHGIVEVTILPGSAGYVGSTRNGVTTQDWVSPWDGSYRVRPAPAEEDAHDHGGEAVNPPRVEAAEVRPDPGRLDTYRDRVGQSFLFEVTGRTNGGVYGTDTYTDDSDLATAAVHAGVLRDGETGVVKVTILPGQEAYVSTTRNGVTTSGWTRWDGSFRVERAR